MRTALVAIVLFGVCLGTDTKPPPTRTCNAQILASFVNSKTAWDDGSLKEWHCAAD
jgi:hypothetical protein